MHFFLRIAVIEHNVTFFWVDLHRIRQSELGLVTGGLVVQTTILFVGDGILKTCSTVRAAHMLSSD